MGESVLRDAGRGGDLGVGIERLLVDWCLTS